MSTVTYGSGDEDDPWILKTPPQSSEYRAWREPKAKPPALVVQVGTTRLSYHLRAIADLAAMLKARGGWVELGNADEGKPVRVGLAEPLRLGVREFDTVTVAQGFDGPEPKEADGLHLVPLRTPLAATGFNVLGPDMTDSDDQAQRRYNTLTDATDTAALAFLGLTVTCARCHDHKFEPITQVDYFRLQAFFTPAATAILPESG